MIRTALQADAASIADIYNHYIHTSVITFEEESVSTETMGKRMQDSVDLSLPWLVAEENNELLGFAYASPWKTRSAYRFSVESTVYLKPTSTARGLGSALYAELFSRLKQTSAHAVIAGIALPNSASVALHEKFGMEKVGHFPEVGYKFNRWIDVGYWQKTI